MSRPSFQFYTKDWRSNSKLRRCTPAARGVWIDILCALHDSDEYGIARYPLKELASEVGASLPLVRELVDKGVLKGTDKEDIEPFVYVPRSGRKDGPPVTLLPAQCGPLWYSSRMVKDEYISTHRGEGTRFSGGKGETPKPSPIRREGDGPPSSSSSATAVEETSKLSLAPARPSAKTVPDCPHVEVLALWAEVLPTLPQHKPSLWRGARADHLRARWRESAIEHGWKSPEDGMGFLRKLFGYVGRSRFLSGKAPPSPGRPPFVVELGWLVESQNWAKVIEGKYHPEAA